MKFIQIPFGYLLDYLYQFTTSYGLALILFAIMLKLILLPSTAKSKKSTMRMSRLQPRLQALQKKYAGDQQKLNEATRELYKQEGVGLGAGCLWSLLPLFLLIPLYQVVSNPITYMLHETPEVAAQIVAKLQEVAPHLFENGGSYGQLIAAANIDNYKEALSGIAIANEATWKGLEFTFLGINLGITPTYNVFSASFWNWPTIGGFLLPVLSAGSQVASMLINQKMNNSLVTNEKGLQDKETAKNAKSSQNNKIMMYIFPGMSLLIGFAVPGALSLYWLAQGIISTSIDIYLTKKYRKIYDAEDAIRLAKALEQEAIEEEKERLRAERRAANPDGITANTSKKKLQQQQQKEQEAAKAAAAKEYAIKKGLITEEATDESAPTVMSGIPSRPHCKGRNYDPNRYASEKTEE